MSENSNFVTMVAFEWGPPPDPEYPDELNEVQYNFYGMGVPVPNVGETVTLDLDGDDPLVRQVGVFKVTARNFWFYKDRGTRGQLLQTICNVNYTVEPLEEGAQIAHS